jgi:uncharacterized protein (DUF2384 family)
MERMSPEANGSAYDSDVEIVTTHAVQLMALQQQVMALERKNGNLMVALASQRMIGIAVGLVAQRTCCTSSEAWERLTRLSQDTNVKVRELARVMVDAVDGVTRDEDVDLLDRLSSRLLGGPWR